MRSLSLIKNSEGVVLDHVIKTCGHLAQRAHCSTGTCPTIAQSEEIQMAKPTTDSKTRKHARWSLFPYYEKRTNTRLKNEIFALAKVHLGATDEQRELFVGVSYRTIATAERILAILVPQAEAAAQTGTKPHKAWRPVTQIEAMIRDWTFPAPAADAKPRKEQKPAATTNTAPQADAKPRKDRKAA